MQLKWLKLARIDCDKTLSILVNRVFLISCLSIQYCVAQDFMLNVDNTTTATFKPEGSAMWVTVGEHRFIFTLAENQAAQNFATMLPLTLNMTEHNNNEKYAELPNQLPTNANRPGTLYLGDVMLFGASTLVIFYQTFDSSYSYTPIGRINDPSGLAQALGQYKVNVLFSKN